MPFFVYFAFFLTQASAECGVNADGQNSCPDSDQAILLQDRVKVMLDAEVQRVRDHDEMTPPGPGRRRVAPGRVDVEVGARKHRGRTSWGNNGDTITAPEYKTSERLTSGGDWETCDGPPSKKCSKSSAGSCFRGCDRTGQLDAKVANGVVAAMEVNLKCKPDENARFEVRASGGSGRTLQNGQLKIYYNEALVHTMEDRNRADYEHAMAVTDSDVQTVRIELHQRDQSRLAYARIQFAVRNVLNAMESCMEGKQNHGQCVRELGGDGSDAELTQGNKLRNNKGMQLQCLDPPSAGTGFSSVLQGECDKWADCLDEAGTKQFLIDVLVGGGTVASPSLLEQDGGSFLQPGPGHTSCIHPKYADPESWDCQCYDDWIAKCKDSAGNDLTGAARQTCIHEILCCHPKVCTAWKSASACNAVSCPAFLMEVDNRTVSLLDVTDKIRARSSTEETALIADGGSQALDNLLSGKCA